MRIVVLDAHALNPGDLDWGPLLELGPCEVHERTDDQRIVERAQGADCVLTNKTRLTRSSLALLPALRYIGVLATGFNVVDCDAARERSIPVTNVPTYGTDSVAQLTFAHILHLASHVGPLARSVSQGRWNASRDWSYWDAPLLELHGLVMGIVGFGRIGRATARVARAFGMTIVAAETNPAGSDPGVRFVPLDELFRTSDVVSLHCPLTEDTRKIVSRGRLAMMKQSAFLINTSRGGLVDEAALAEALRAGQIAGAGLDVLSEEPPPDDNPLLAAPNCIITPHVAWATKAARQRLLDEAVENLRAFRAGIERNVVNRVQG